MKPLPSSSMSSPGIVVVDPDVPGEVRVAVGDAAVDHADDHGAAPRRRRPGLRRVDVGVRELVQAPELRVARVVGRDLRVAADVVRLGEGDVRTHGRAPPRRRAPRRPPRAGRARAPALPSDLHDLRASRARRAAPRRDAGLELDDQLALTNCASAPLASSGPLVHPSPRPAPGPVTGAELPGATDADDPSPHRGRDSEPLAGKKKGAAQSSTRPMRTQPLWPPSPIAFESATRTCASRASFGT